MAPVKGLLIDCLKIVIIDDRLAAINAQVNEL